MTDADALSQDEQARAALRAIFDAAVASAAPGPAVLRHLPGKPKGRCVVVGAGKASAAMAAAVDAAWPDVDLGGVVVTRHGHAVDAGRIEIREAAHPVPDQSSVEAARRILDAVKGLSPEDLVLVLISGGGSSLMVAPADGLTLADKQAVNAALLRSGATIGEMNTVRKHLSAIKGGRLAYAAYPARVITLVISDVPGDDPGAIASGPTVPDISKSKDALDILDRYGMVVPRAVRDHLLKTEDKTPESPPPDVRIVAAPGAALAAAAARARDFGVMPLVLGDALEGEAREMAIVLFGIARSVCQHGLPVAAPAVLLSGGEGTVTIGSKGAGAGGRNTEFLLSLAIAARGHPRIWAIAGDSDGIDGTEDAAGAIVTPTTLARGAAAALSARDFLERHDSYTFFKGIGDLVKTGPTLTNVNDIRAILIT